MAACTERLKMMKKNLFFINKFLDVNNPMYAYKTDFKMHIFMSLG